MRALFRLIAYLVLAGGVITAVVDATRSVALSTPAFTQLRDLVAMVAPEAGLLGAARESVTGMALSVPVAALAAALFVLIYGLASRGSAPRHF